MLPTPARAPANAYCERLVGTVRRECLDFMIPLGEKKLGRILAEWVTHYNQGRPHLSLGPGIPEPSKIFLPPQNHDRHSPASGWQSRGAGSPLRPPPRIPLGKDRRVKGRLLRRRRTLITSPLEWQMTAAPVPHPIIPVLAERGGTQLQTPRPILLVDTREQNPFNFSCVSEDGLRGIEKVSAPTRRLLHRRVGRCLRGRAKESFVT